MDEPTQLENHEPENGTADDLSTRRIDPGELNLVVDQEPQTVEEPATVFAAQAEDQKATKVVLSIEEEIAAAPKTYLPPYLTSPPSQPASFAQKEKTQGDNRTTLFAIIALAVVALVCICACTAIVITALILIPTY